MKTFKLTIACLFVTLFTFADVSISEKDALVAIYNSTQGNQWNNTWDINTSIENWYGVVVKDNKVVELNLQFNNLNGKLPSNIGDLAHLKKMNLGFNKLQGTLPASIGDISSLTSLELFMNKFEIRPDRRAIQFAMQC